MDHTITADQRKQLHNLIQTVGTCALAPMTDEERTDKLNDTYRALWDLWNDLEYPAVAAFLASNAGRVAPVADPVKGEYLEYARMEKAA